jgi:hypothetical protein
LNSRQAGIEEVGHLFDGAGLCEARKTFDEEMPVCEETDDQAFDHSSLAQDGLADLFLEI